MRFEGDTWDIVTGVGKTALQVAAARAVVSKQPDPLIVDEYAERFIVASGDADTIQLISDPALWAEHPLATGAMGLRTKFFDDFFLAATDAGVRQVVILAAGLDARAYRIDWPEGVVVFEVDQPMVLQFKRRVLIESRAEAKASRREVAVDLRDDWPAALLAAGFDPNAPTAWSAEGLLAYLPGAAQDALFARITELSTPGSRLAVDDIDIGVDIDFEELVDAQTEQFGGTPIDASELASLFYTDDRKEPGEWLAEQGWNTRSVPPSDLAERYQRPLPTMPEPFATVFGSIRYLSAHKFS
ncbi:class I SAM-dependent methyltransferase [Nocardia sp. NPDC049149]|uniref:class I SAM-dependent methyltransferase n=1 Tax=Nocardia sp. NPDC049149 TaxID=3364315 RepID=UPI003720EE5E